MVKDADDEAVSADAAAPTANDATPAESAVLPTSFENMLCKGKANRWK